jgi:hypothetical protein
VGVDLNPGPGSLVELLLNKGTHDMNKLVLAGCVGVLAMGSGCAAGARAYMDSSLSNRSEPATVWTRPQEVGFDFGPEVAGEVSRQCVLGFICWGYDDGGAFAGLTGLIGAFTGNASASSDPLVGAAAAVAVRDTPKADGIFVVSHETDSLNIGVYYRRAARVRGKSITLRPIGEVSQERADRYRNLRAIGGGSLLQVTNDMIR